MADINAIWASLQDSSAYDKKDYTKRHQQSMSSKISERKQSSKVIFDSKKSSKTPATFVEETHHLIKSQHQNYIQIFDEVVKELELLPTIDDSKLIMHKMEVVYTNLSKSIHTINIVNINSLLNDSCKALLKYLSHSSEKCRELAIKILILMLEFAVDLSIFVGYFFPCILRRLVSAGGYDEQTNTFVHSIEEQESLLRGRVVEKEASHAPLFLMVEKSEEVRLQLCHLLRIVIQRAIILKSSALLQPYFQESILMLQYQLFDPYPAIKIEICAVLELLATANEFNIGMKYFAVGLIRSLLGLLQHRQAKVRIAVISAIHACILIPDKAKRKGAGSEAIRDLVGFHDGNTISIASFYTSSTTVNYLASITSDSSVAVRERVVRMLTDLLTILPDCYDHQTRLLPYLLDLLIDESPIVAKATLCGLISCGEKYETEHADDIIEKKQFAIDGDDGINLLPSPPVPFQSRPSLGVRMFVKGNVKRFLHALVSELTNWQGTTRIKSAKLLNIILYLCEDYLTIEAHILLPCFLKVLRYTDSEHDKALEKIILEAIEMYGRYTSPTVYLHILGPSLQETSEGIKIQAIKVLTALLRGSNQSQLSLHFYELIETVTPILEEFLLQDGCIVPVSPEVSLYKAFAVIPIFPSSSSSDTLIKSDTATDKVRKYKEIMEGLRNKFINSKDAT